MTTALESDGPVPAGNYHILATRLTDSVRSASEVLAPFAPQLNRTALAALTEVLAAFNQRRIHIAVCGEVKAGKSTLVNALAGATLSPMAFEPVTAAPIRITYGPTTRWRVGERTLASAAELKDAMRPASPPLGDIVIETNLPLLQLGGQVDLLDTPGVGGETHLDPVVSSALRTLDAVVLVVRYPALFSRFTRTFAADLQSEVGKLFVVWNLDAACANLTAEQRAHHGELLRQHLGSGHPPYLVDARAGLLARELGENQSVIDSGLHALIDGLAGFVSSSARDVAALREATKTAHACVSAAQRTLDDRRVSLQESITTATTQVDAVRAASRAEADAECGRLEGFDAAIDRIEAGFRATATDLAAALRRHLRRARWRWIRRPDLPALASGVATGAAQYADAVEGSIGVTLHSLQQAARNFGISVPENPRPRSELAAGALTSDDRQRHAQQGMFRAPRRAVWRHWYLPGLSALDRDRLRAEVASQQEWLRDIVATARADATSTLESRLSEIDGRTAAAVDEIRTETNLGPNEEEVRRIDQALPILAAQVQMLDGIATAALALV